MNSETQWWNKSGFRLMWSFVVLANGDALEKKNNLSEEMNVL